MTKPATKKRRSISDLFNFDEPTTTTQTLSSEFDTPAANLSPKAEGRTVPNVFPRVTPTTYRIALIGEAPGEREVDLGKPFVGASGYFLDQWTSHAGIVRDCCFIGNICQYRPPNNDISCFALDGDQIQSGLQQLESDLTTFDPNICVLMGKTALWAANGMTDIGSWRGSVFIGTKPGPFYGRKCIATYHPAFCLRQYEGTPLFFFDLKKAVKHAGTKDWNPPQRELLSDLPLADLLHELDQIIEHKLEVSPDIEGGIGTMSCCSLATSPIKSILIPFARLDGSSYWPTAEEEYQVWKRFIAIMSDPAIKKCFQNGLYDRFVLQYSYGLVVLGCQDDTMPKFWELYCELEKSLGFQCSILTDEPFYKFERKGGDQQTFYRYCCKDSATTFEINKKLDLLLDGGRKAHYTFNHTLLNPLLYMELFGINYDRKLAKQRLIEVDHAVHVMQHRLNLACGIDITKISLDELRYAASSTLCYKNDPTRPKKDCEEDWETCLTILQKPKPWSEADYGHLSVCLNLSMNIKSPMFKNHIYNVLKLPKQYNRQTKELTTNYEALLKIQKASPNPAVQIALELGELRTRSQMLQISADMDGRIRCGYNIVGTETGRLTCYTSPTGSGYNLQTIPADNKLKPKDHPLHKGMRDLFIPDNGFYMFQCDLSGADGWTIGAHLKALGDSSMLDDLYAGIKPAQRVCYMLRHGVGSLACKTRSEVKELLKEIGKEDYDYFACKQGIWGTAYLMGPDLLANVILIQSEGAVALSRSEVKDFQRAVFAAYRFKLWHDWTSRQLSRKPEMTSASGQRRRFFGRSTEILGEALANEPQQNTTYATNTAMLRLWTDEENRDGNRLKIIPLHQVHDSILGQFKIEDTTWAIKKIQGWFDNPMIIAGQRIVIPFAGEYGTSWGNLNVGKI